MKTILTAVLAIAVCSSTLVTSAAFAAEPKKQKSAQKPGTFKNTQGKSVKCFGFTSGGGFRSGRNC
jgi:hypothetical protein